MASSIAIFIMALTVASANIPFTYYNQEPNDPQYVALLRDALMKVGLNPNGITLVSIQSKNELYRWAYKATYTNKLSQTCYLKFRVNKITGAEVPAMPICDGVSIGQGYGGGQVRYDIPGGSGQISYGIPGGSGQISYGIPGVTVGIPGISVGVPGIGGQINYGIPGGSGQISYGIPGISVGVPGIGGQIRSSGGTINGEISVGIPAIGGTIKYGTPGCKICGYTV